MVGVSLALTLGPGLTSGMAPRRRPRGTLVNPVSIGYEVEREAKEQFDAIAERLGVSSAVFFEQVVAHIDLTSEGVPTWWERPEELPINPD